jgi:hypothetical protein
MKIVRLALSTLVCFCALAQDRVPKVIVLPASSVDAAKEGSGLAFKEVPLRDKLTLARNATTPAFSSPEAQAVIDTALRTKEFKFALPPPDATVILTNDGEDIVVARGRFQQQTEGITNYVLWNEPASESLLLQVPVDAVQTTASVVQLLSAIFEWDPRSRPNLAIAVAEPRCDGVEFLRGATSDNDFRQIVTTREEVSGAIYEGEAWLSITHRHGQGYPKEMVNFPERFPPLRSRVDHLSTAQLMTAIANPGRAQYTLSGTVPRATFLMHELFARPDFNGDDFRKLTSIPDSRPASPVPLVVSEAARAGIDGRVTDEILDYFRDRIAKTPGSATFEAPAYMSFLNTHQIAGYCEDGLNFLARRVAVRESLRYVGRFCHTRAALEAVSGVGDEYSKDRAVAMAQIRKALE